MIVLSGLTRVDQALLIRDALRAKFVLAFFEVEQVEPNVAEWYIVTKGAAVTALAIYSIFAEGVAAGLKAEHEPLF